MTNRMEPNPKRTSFLQQQYMAQRNRAQSNFELNTHHPTTTDRANICSSSTGVHSNAMNFTKSADGSCSEQQQENKANYTKRADDDICCSTNRGSCLTGLLIGILVGCVLLAVLMTIWLKESGSTTISTTINSTMATASTARANASSTTITTSITITTTTTTTSTATTSTTSITRTTSTTSTSTTTTTTSTASTSTTSITTITSTASTSTTSITKITSTTSTSTITTITSTTSTSTTTTTTSTTDTSTTTTITTTITSDTTTITLSTSPNGPFIPNSVIYSQDFVSGVIASSPCTVWLTFIAQLIPQNYTLLTINGSRDSVGVNTSDPVIISNIALALRTSIVYGPITSNNQSWAVGLNGNFSKLSASGNAAGCPNPGYIVRPCNGNINWGGINGLTCGAPDQTMTIIFNY